MSTVAELLIAIGFVLPGFITADLAEMRRARLRRSDPELILRALTYALLIQGAVALTGWTAQLITDTDSGSNWEQHVSAIVLFVFVVSVLVPTILGLMLNWVLRRAERRGNLSPLHYALGGRDGRLGWDYIFERFGSGYVFLTLKPGVSGRPNFLVGKFAENSWAPQQLADARDLYLEEIWIADENGRIVSSFTDRRGLWIPIEQIDMLQFVDPPATFGDNGSTLWRWLGGSRLDSAG